MNTLGKIWENRYKIAEGIKNSIFKKEDVEEVVKERMKICAPCIDLDVEGTYCEIAGTQPCCKQCGCSLHIKLRSLSSGCGNEEDPKWNPIITQTEEDELKETIGYDDGHHD